ncbi:MAG: TMEM175 family protein [Fimbriimonas sp.]
MSEVTEDAFDFGRTRLETLTDGIFAIAMTVLVLTLKPPDLPDSATNQQVMDTLAKMVPNFIAFVASFFTLGMFWATHHAAFRYLTRTDRVIVWLNMSFLLMVSIVPFTTGLYAGDVDNTIVNTVFGANLILMGLLNYAMWAHARARGYVYKEISEEARHFSTRRILTAPAIAAIAMVASMIQPRFAEVIYFSMVPLFMVTVKPFALPWAKKGGNISK